MLKPNFEKADGLGISNSSQRIPHKKSSQKNSPKKFLLKKSSKKIPKKSKKFPNNFLIFFLRFYFENIQIPTSHLEAENPFRLVCFPNLNWGP